MVLEPKEPPEILMFTAPLEICEGGCKSKLDNINLVFPLYIGYKKSKTIYPDLYPRDYKNIYTSAKEAPFKKSSTMMPYTLCSVTEKKSKVCEKLTEKKCVFRVSKVQHPDNLRTRQVARLKHNTLHDNKFTRSISYLTKYW